MERNSTGTNYGRKTHVNWDSEIFWIRVRWKFSELAWILIFGTAWEKALQQENSLWYICVRPGIV